MSKKKLIEECKTLIIRESDEGGIADHDDFNNIVTDLFPRLLPYLNKEGLNIIKSEFEQLLEDEYIGHVNHKTDKDGRQIR